MKISTLRKLLGDSQFDDIELLIAIDPAETTNGCFNCPFNISDNCQLGAQFVMDKNWDYFSTCQLPTEPSS